MNKNYVSLYKSGKFYNAFGDDGLILHHLIGYKFVEYKQSVGFPESAFGKVKSLLDDVDISYKVYDKDILIEEKKGNNKKYNKVLSEALKKYDLEKKLIRIKDKINNFSAEDLEKIIEGIESGKDNE